MYLSYPIDIIFRNLLCGIVFFNSFHECHVHSDTNNVLRVDCCSWICILWKKKFKQWWKPIPLILTIKKQSRLILTVQSQCPITITNNSASSYGQCTLDVNVGTWEGGGLYIQNYSGYHHNWSLWARSLWVYIIVRYPRFYFCVAACCPKWFSPCTMI